MYEWNLERVFQALTQSHRWSHHADMVKQLAECVKGRVAERHGMKDVEVYVDVWISLNRRFTQRYRILSFCFVHI